MFQSLAIALETQAQRSAPDIASYILGTPAYYSSHTFSNLYMTPLYNRLMVDDMKLLWAQKRAMTRNSDAAGTLAARDTDGDGAGWASMLITYVKNLVLIMLITLKNLC